MMEERYHATTQYRFYPDICNVNKNITVEAKLVSPLTYIACRVPSFGVGIFHVQAKICLMYKIN